MSKQPELTVIYDADCGVCEKFRRFIEHSDKRASTRLLSLYDNFVLEEFPSIERENCKKEIHVIDSAGNVTTGGLGITRILHEIPYIGSFAKVLRIYPFRLFVDWGYKWFASNRYRFSRACGLNFRPKQKP